MADIEIYKALECCKRKKCDECPYRKYNTYGCKDLMISDTLHNFGRLMREAEDA
jgi:hypothetical protein